MRFLNILQINSLSDKNFTFPLYSCEKMCYNKDDEKGSGCPGSDGRLMKEKEYWI